MTSDQSSPLNIILIGTYGSGKGTQAQFISRDYDLKIFGAGEILRSEIRKKTTLGKKIEKTVNAGRLVPNSLVGRMLDKFIDKLPRKRGFIIDGTPRNLDQKKIIDRIFKKHKRKMITILIHITAFEAKRRLRARRICVGCHTKSAENLKGRACRSCGGKLIIREDDRPDIIDRRLKSFQREVVPVIRSYRKEKLLYKIDGNQSRAAVYRDIRALLKILGY